MSFIQRLFMRLLPRRWAEQMKADSQAWRIRCTGCNRSRSIWDIGGIRWKAYSRGKRTIVRCSQCAARGGGGMQIAAIEKTPAESSE